MFPWVRNNVCMSVCNCMDVCLLTLTCLVLPALVTSGTSDSESSSCKCRPSSVFPFFSPLPFLCCSSLYILLFFMSFVCGYEFPCVCACCVSCVHTHMFSCAVIMCMHAVLCARHNSTFPYLLEKSFQKLEMGRSLMWCKMYDYYAFKSIIYFCFNSWPRGDPPYIPTCCAAGRYVNDSYCYLSPL